MSSQDRELLLKAGLTATRVAQLLGKSRQAVSKGLNGADDYFSPADLLRIKEGVERQEPEKVASLQEAVGEMFDDLAERLGARAPAHALEAGLALAERLWLIFPRFSVSFHEQPDAYLRIFGAVDARRPASSPGERPLEVIVFCDGRKNEIEEQFDHVWFDERQLAVIACEIIGRMFAPIVVLDPHREESRGCYMLSGAGFVPMLPAQARASVSEFAAEVTDKIRDAAPAQSGRPINMLTASPSTLLAVGINKI